MARDHINNFEMYYAQSYVEIIIVQQPINSFHVNIIIIDRKPHSDHKSYVGRWTIYEMKTMQRDLLFLVLHALYDNHGMAWYGLVWYGMHRVSQMTVLFHGTLILFMILRRFAFPLLAFGMEQIR